MLIIYTKNPVYRIFFILNKESLLGFIDEFNSMNIKDVNVVSPIVEGVAQLASIFCGYMIKGIGKQVSEEYMHEINKAMSSIYGASAFVGQRGVLSKSIHVIDSEDKHHELVFPFNYGDLHNALSKKGGVDHVK